MWKKVISKEGRTGLTAENFGLTLGSTLLPLNVSREEMDSLDKYKLEVILTLISFLSQFQVDYYVCYHNKYCF